MPASVMKRLISGFMTQASGDVQTFDAAIRRCLRGLDADEMGAVLRQGIAQANGLRDSSRRGVTLGVLSRHLAEAAVARGDFPGAATHYGLAARELVPVLEAGDRAQFLLDQAWVSHCLGDYSGSLKLCAQAQAALAQVPEPVPLSLAHSMRGINYYRLGQLEDALWEHSEALSLREACHDLSGQASSFNNLGNVYMDRGEWDKAEGCYLDSLARYRRLGYLDRIAAVENNLGNLAAYQGEFGMAEERHGRALALRSKLGDRFGAGASRCALAYTWLRAGKIGDAIRGFQRGLRLLEVSGAGELKAEGLIGLAQAYLVSGDVPEARDALQLGMDSALRCQNQLQLGSAHVLLARIERLEGHVDEAIEAMQTSEALLDQIGSHYEIAKARLEAAHVHLANRARDRAKEELAIAIRELESLGAKPDLVEARALEARLSNRLRPVDATRGPSC